MIQTETIDLSLLDLDLRTNQSILQVLLDSQQQAVVAVQQASTQLDQAVHEAALRLAEDGSAGRLVLLGAGASGRIAVQDGAELWPTFSWPHERLLCCMAGGQQALTQSVENVEDDTQDAVEQVQQYNIGTQDVVVAMAASGRSAWTCEWLRQARAHGALCIGMANNANTPLLELAQIGVFLDTGAEVLAGSTRMAAGTAQKIALNLFSTTLMIRLNRTYGNLMVDMGAVNNKLDTRRVKLLQGVLPNLNDAQAQRAIDDAKGWVKLAALLASGDSEISARKRLRSCQGSLRQALGGLTRSYGELGPLPSSCLNFLLQHSAVKRICHSAFQPWE